MSIVGLPARRITDSPLARRNPTVKVALLFVVSAVMLFVFDPVTPTVLYLLGLAVVLLYARVSPRTVLVGHVPFVAFATGLLVVNALSRPGQVRWQAGILRVTDEGLTVGLALAMRTLLIGILAIAFLASTDPVALMTSLNQNARLSPRVTYSVLAGYRLLQDMPREWQTIRQAHAVRLPLRSDGQLPRSPRSLASAVFALLVVSVRKGERMAQSLESRGLGLSPRTVWRPVRVTGSDWVMVAVVLATLSAVLVGSANMGFLRGVGVLSG